MSPNTTWVIKPNSVTVVSTNTDCYANACCWRGKTSNGCDSENGDYSGCNRTQCTQYAASIICNNLNYGGRTWRLPTKDELSKFYPTYSKNIGTSGLMLCDYYSGYGSARCYPRSVCSGAAYGSNCYPYEVWSSTLNGSSNAYHYYLHSGSWNSFYYDRRDAASVRCVSVL